MYKKYLCSLDINVNVSIYVNESRNLQKIYIMSKFSKIRDLWPHMRSWDNEYNKCPKLICINKI